MNRTEGAITAAAAGSYLVSSVSSAQMARAVRKADAAERARSPAKGPTRGVGGRFASRAPAPSAMARAGNSVLRSYSAWAKVAPAVMAAAAVAKAGSTYADQIHAGQTPQQATMRAAASATPLAAAAALPTVIGRLAPNVAASVARVALPLAGVAAGIGALEGGYQAWKRGAGIAGISKGAALGAVDVLTGRLASLSINAVRGNPSDRVPVVGAFLNPAAESRTRANEAASARAGELNRAKQRNAAAEQPNGNGNVKAYTRKDGTPVAGYQRAPGAMGI